MIKVEQGRENGIDVVDSIGGVVMPNMNFFSAPLLYNDFRSVPGVPKIKNHCLEVVWSDVNGPRSRITGNNFGQFKTKTDCIDYESVWLHGPSLNILDGASDQILVEDLR